MALREIPIKISRGKKRIIPVCSVCGKPITDGKCVADGGTRLYQLGGKVTELQASLMHLECLWENIARRRFEFLTEEFNLLNGNVNRSKYCRAKLVNLVTKQEYQGD